MAYLVVSVLTEAQARPLRSYEHAICAATRGLEKGGRSFSCEIASNCDPSQGRSMSLITRVNPLPGWGHAWTRKMTPSIPIFRNEINALGNFRDGVNIASEFTFNTSA